MALSTTQSIWRSGGGDQTRTAYCGTAIMVAQFYIADAGPAATANVKVSSASGANNLILPAGAVVTGITITSATDTPGGTFDLGWKTLDGSPSDTNGLLDGASAATGNFVYGTATTGDDFGVAMSADEMVYITVTDNTAGAGKLSGFISYYVTDPLVGQQNV